MTDNKEFAKQMRENAVKNEQGNIVCSPELWEEIASIVERAIIPPCKVGDKIYITTCDSPTRIEETRVSQIKIKVKENGKISYRISAPCVYDTWGDAHWTFCAFEFGETVFLTKEEAEKHLKEREKV